MAAQCDFSAKENSRHAHSKYYLRLVKCVYEIRTVLLKSREPLADKRVAMSPTASAVAVCVSKIPMILGGNFNINFATDEAEPLIAFLRDKFNLQTNTNLNIPTPNSKTRIDAVFSRY